MKPTYLYIKHHTRTGMNYFGKTTRNDVDKYLGSGKYWKDHINKHGKEHVITMWVSEPFTNEDILVEYAMLMSKEFNIVNSDKWANLIEENGLDGGSFGSGEYNVAKRPEVRKKISESLLGHKFGMNGKTHSEETKRKQSQSAKIAGTGKFLLGKKKTDTHKKNMAISALNRKKDSCIHCGKICAINVLNRWHNKNCKAQ